MNVIWSLIQKHTCYQIIFLAILRSLHVLKESLGRWRVDARCYQDVYVNSFFPRTARPWNYLPIEGLTLPMILVALSLELTDIF